MKKMVMAGLVMIFAYAANAQSYKKGDQVEINRNLSDEGISSWVKGNIVALDLENKQYRIKSADRKEYNIPFLKESSWMRKPVQPLSAALLVKDEGLSCSPTEYIVQQKIQEEFLQDFSEYDSVVISYNSVEALQSYKNTDAVFGIVDAEVFPFNVDFTVRLVTKNEDGSQKKINWQFKRKYLLHQNSKGKCSLTVAEKEESLLSHI